MLALGGKPSVIEMSSALLFLVFCSAGRIVTTSQRDPSQRKLTSPNLGKASCPCVEWAGLQNYVVNGYLIYRPASHSSVSYQYPQDYGSYECKMWDANLPPSCTGNQWADFCNKAWCYVASTCTGVAKAKTIYWQEDLYWSYETCGDASAFSNYSVNNQGSILNLLQVLEGYLQTTRDLIENTYAGLGSVNGECAHVPFCNCPSCSDNSVWNGKYDFNNVGVLMKSSAMSQHKRTDTCISEGVAAFYRKIASKEMDEHYSRPGWQYFAFQDSGTLTQWPAQHWCPADYDPRFRPFFASGATGPKDVVIVVDVSGSMGTNGRDGLAKIAVKKILDTLSWKDFTTVILFNGAIHAVFSDLLQPVTDALRTNIQTWVDSCFDWSSGGTNFVAAIDHAFTVIENSVAAAQTSMCQKAILFLTDGQATYTEDNFQTTRQKALRFDTILFTYALGSGADTGVTKRLACENKGVFYSVPDNSDLATIMAQYYDYFASGQEVCSPAYVKYNDIVGGTEIWTGCLPAYKRTSSHPETLGVGCIDVNVLANPPQLKSQASWEDFVCRASDITKRCRALSLDECRLQKIRLKVGLESVCGAATSQSVSESQCGCLSHNCQDDTLWRDAQGYFCDTWIGDDCSGTYTGYTAQDLATVRSKCPRSCGLCAWQNPCPYPNGPPCQEMGYSTDQMASQCRACNGKVSGMNIDGKPMCCPGNSSSFAPTCSSSLAPRATYSQSCRRGVTQSAAWRLGYLYAMLWLAWVVAFAGIA